MEHEAGEGQEVQAGQHGGQPLVVTSEAAEAGGPGEVALNDPAFGQEHEAAFGLGQADDLQTTSSWIPCAAAAAAGSSPV